MGVRPTKTILLVYFLAKQVRSSRFFLNSSIGTSCLPPIFQKQESLVPSANTTISGSRDLNSISKRQKTGAVSPLMPRL